MDVSQYSIGIPVGVPLVFHSSPIVFHWYSRGVPQVVVCYLTGIPEMLLGYVIGVPQVPRRYTIDISHILDIP